ncbi:hypothetical protein BDM02DRAFT_2865004 [Thelephora ganbajun]|uniref:Uncharacterized protein n=1 Tax=Thelephora ganbajun TaxID=370292 RepID=A0ACB6ZBB3_THEGA|nr:hypothetical protein BDM02DRAFT_2865004 [Thelephora ganbajun]
MPFLRRMGLLGYSVSTGGMKGETISLLVLGTERLASVEMNAHHKNKTTRDHRYIHRSWKRRWRWLRPRIREYSWRGCRRNHSCHRRIPFLNLQSNQRLGEFTGRLLSDALLDSTEVTVARLDGSPRASRVRPDCSRSSAEPSQNRCTAPGVAIGWGRDSNTIVFDISDSYP